MEPKIPSSVIKSIYNPSVAYSPVKRTSCPQISSAIAYQTRMSVARASSLEHLIHSSETENGGTPSTVVETNHIEVPRVEPLTSQADIERAKVELKQKLGIPDINEVEIVTQYHKHMLTDVFEVFGLLGVGAFGVVLEAWNKNTEELVALKVSKHDDSKRGIM
jgi:hypothetical protein